MGAREEAERAEKESLGWLALSEGAFSFWDNEDWDLFGDEAAESSTERPGS